MLPVAFLATGCSRREPPDAAARRDGAAPASFTPDSQHTALAPERLRALEAAIEAHRSRLAVPGAAVVIVRDDRVILRAGFGVRDVQRGLPVTARTRFNIGSCTKAFTALATVLSADAGALSLDDSPKRFLPYFALQDPAADRRVTLRDLLSHRTGVPDDLPAGWFERYGTPEALIKAAMQAKPTAKLGQRFQYNNYLFVAVGEALAAAHGSTFEAVMAQRVFGPLGMRTTSLSLSAMRQGDDFSHGYGDDPGRTQLPMDTMAYLRGIAAAGGINSNVEEMAQWVRLMLRGGVLDGKRLLSDKGFRELLTPAVATSSGHYGLGMEIEEWHGDRLYHHRGGVLGFSARCDLLPARGLGWVILTNVDDQALPQAIRESIYDLLVR